MCGVAIFELGSLISALANSSAMLIVGRAISGSGASGLITGFLSILAASVPIDKRPMYMGLVMGVSSLGIVIGPVIGGVFTQHATWRWCFYLNLPFGGITLGILSLLRIPSAASSTGPKVSLKESLNRLDLIGFTMFAPGVIMLLFAFDWGGNKYEWKSATIIGLFCGTVGILAVFLIWEKFRGKNAMIPLALLKNRVLIFASITMIMSQGSLLVVIYYLPLWFQVAKGASPTMGGVYFLPSVGSQIISSIVTGKLSKCLHSFISSYQLTHIQLPPSESTRNSPSSAPSSHPSPPASSQSSDPPPDPVSG
jgi:MFS family permease